MPLLRIGAKFYQYSDNEKVEDFVSRKFGLAPGLYWISATNVLNFKIQGGHANFGRALKQEGRRRSRRLSRYKDSCNTIHGNRIGDLRARKRIKELNETIKKLEKSRAEKLAKKRKSNTEQLTEILETQDQEISKTVERAISISKQVNMQPNQTENHSLVFNIDLSELK